MVSDVCWLDLFKNNLHKATSKSPLSFCRAKHYNVKAWLLQKGSSFTLLIIFWKWKGGEGEKGRAYSPQCKPPNFP